MARKALLMLEEGGVKEWTNFGGLWNWNKECKIKLSTNTPTQRSSVEDVGGGNALWVMMVG